MFKLSRSRLENLKLLTLAFAIALGLGIEARVAHAEDPKIACLEYLIETGDAGGVPA